MTEKYPTWLTNHVKEWAKKASDHCDIVFYHWQ